MALAVDDLVDLTQVLEAVVPIVRRRTADADEVADLCQETMARVLEARSRLDGGALVPYAVTVAKNLVTEAGRRRTVDLHNQHRLLERPPEDRPEDGLLEAEQRATVEAALANLEAEDRVVLIDHIVHGLDTATMGQQRRVSAGAVATHLARARAKLRVEYVVAAHHVELPTERCRPVLVALSAADVRRQGRLLAGEHLDACATCADLARPLVERDRSLLGVAPVAFPVAIWAMLRGAVARHPAASAGAGASAVAAGVAIAVLVAGSGRTTTPQAGATTAPVASTAVTASPTTPAPPAGATDLSVGGQPLAPLIPGGRLGSEIGQPVVATAAPVGQVPAPYGFWLGGGSGQRIWVQLTGTGVQPAQVTPGSHLSFTGKLVAHGPGFAESVGVTTGEGGSELDGMGVHVEVARDQITFVP